MSIETLLRQAEATIADLRAGRLKARSVHDVLDGVRTGGAGDASIIDSSIIEDLMRGTKAVMCACEDAIDHFDNVITFATSVRTSAPITPEGEPSADVVAETAPAIVPPTPAVVGNKRPSLGAIVHYLGERGDHCAAIVVEVHADGSVNLVVFHPAAPDFETTHPVHNIEEGPDYGHWHWPDADAGVVQP
jgi:hypothetical protein